jgi:hypothetical protein
MAAQWAISPATESATRPEAHRPDSRRDGHAYCGAPLEKATRIEGQLPGGIRHCKPCRHALAQHRRAANAEREKQLVSCAGNS